MEYYSYRCGGRAILLLGLAAAALTTTFSLLSLLAGSAHASPLSVATDVSCNPVYAPWLDEPACITGPGFADLDIAKSARPQPVLAGETLTYTVTITNHGPSPATVVSLIDTLPSAVTLTQTPAGCSGTSQLICGLSDIPIGGSAFISYRVVVSPTFIGAMTNTAVIASAESDPALGNNLAQVQSVVLPRNASNVLYLPVVVKP